MKHSWTTFDGEPAEIEEEGGEYSWSLPAGSVAAVLVREVARQKVRGDELLEACAAKVEAAGCLCQMLIETGCFDGDRTIDYEGDEDVIDEHDPRCPKALAAKLREMRR